MGIEVLVPDVNRSLAEFAADFTDDEGDVGGPRARARGHHLRPGRRAQRGRGLVELIVAEREANGPFVDFYDFCQRVDPQVLNKRTIESLIKAGAFDSLGDQGQQTLRARGLRGPRRRDGGELLGRGL
jgi:DNA polymerase-3 subunit alpha